MDVFPKRFDQVPRVKVVAYLLALVAEDAIGTLLDACADQVGQKPVQLGASMGGSGQAAAPEADGRDAEIASILLHHHVGGDLRGTENAVQCLVDAHRLVDAVLRIGVIRRNGIACGVLDQWQAVGGVSVHLVRAREDEGRAGRMATHGLKKVQRARGIDTEIHVRIPGRPVVRGLRRGVDDRAQIRADLGYECLHQRAVADIEAMMPIVR